MSGATGQAKPSIAVVTGTRAEFGLLRTVLRTISAHDALDLRVVVAGAHLLPPAETWREVAAEFPIAARVEMQRADEPRTREIDALALGRGVQGFAGVFASLRPACALVLGDRIEAFAAASAASVAGIPLAHMHGGDRAEGVADEAMRHAITKLAHIHFPATAQSAERIVRMGEDASRVRVVGSPAIDGLRHIAPMQGAEHESLGAPDTLLLLHPIGRDDDREAAAARAALQALRGRRVLAMMPNSDPGRDGVASALREGASRGEFQLVEHLPRERFIALLARLARTGGALVGNSSAALIEAAALEPALPAVNIGVRQAGRERAGNVVDAEESTSSIAEALDRALRMPRREIAHPYGDGRTGERVAAALVGIDLRDPALVRKRNAH